ncbi:O-acetylhomoserine aminocarboxypropyltransferase [Propionigenium maris DSM 9537]|uniref:O-acetylhomoserine aminocarboxypropyltransferase n=1 Tax=Propionigenium maris DSM 9537 TaxID=1123000 RepID=A0A9W6LPC8_9FUSO|nr:O-acetylhomoserine aminocarboxypropyltransferase/cysteine synthase [Propionigenium maris]GLI56810.1 O-acetylhomoserine aminocarboxypropyltransferase [Propionigenium maris DSM 9537]
MTYRFETLQLHGGQEPDTATGARAVPIYQTSSYVFKDTTHAARLFNLEEPGNIYTRLGNPTTEVLEKRMTLLEGGVGALTVASGSAAVTYSILNIARAGDEIIASNNLYGGTYNLLANTLKDFGITTRFFDPENPQEIEKLITERTRGVYIESLGNPSGQVIDIEAISALAHSHELPLIVDNTFATPYLIKPLEHGADIVVYSATKFLGGHGTTIAGVVVDGGRFDWSKDKFQNFNTPDEGYHGLKYSNLGESAYILRARVKLLRDTGAALSPFNSFLILQGLETLSLRLERHVENARRIASYLDNHPEVEWITHPEFSGEEQKKLVERYLKNGPTSIFTFGLKGGRERAGRFIDSLELFSHLANVADAKSLIIHPATTTHGQLSTEELLQCGIKPETIRISVGIESAEDLIEDLERAISRSLEAETNVLKSHSEIAKVD